MNLRSQLRSVRGYPSAVGKQHLINHLGRTKKLTQREAIYAKCYDCAGFYLDGRLDCETPSCSLYPFMPYRKKNKEKRNKK